MIRAGRQAHVQTSQELAAAMGLKLGSFRNRKPYGAAGFPAPISPDGAGTKLWDAQQTAAFLTGDPVPGLPADNDGGDLLERIEAAEFLGVAPKTWDSYKRDPRIAPHLVKVKGVEHCPRAILEAFRHAPAAPSTGRPRGSGDMVPRDEIEARLGELLEADPALTIATVQEELGLAYSAAARWLPRLRGQRIADRVMAEPGLTADEAAQQLGYPAAVRRAAAAATETVLRGRQKLPYLQRVADAVVAAGWMEHQEVAVREVESDVLAAVLVLDAGASAPALVWDERYGWRTALSRRHPIPKGSWPAEGDGVRYLCPGHTEPGPPQLLAALGS
ncbi:hypothetical protein ABZ819_08840 [Streptomyces venezuelae]|uniref:hypothetical protein n=1 Tax=Streptomyces venezuelae TaxID=54571 RepID=UPI003442F0E9